MAREEIQSCKVAPCAERGLRLLECPLRLSLRSPDFESIILFLEESFVRCLARNKRAELLTGQGAASWRGVLKYCEKAGVPLDSAECTDTLENRNKMLAALVSLAVTLSYEDKRDEGRIRGAESAVCGDTVSDDVKKPLSEDVIRLYEGVIPEVSALLNALNLPPLPEDATPQEVEAALQTVLARVSEEEAPLPLDAEMRKLLKALPAAVGGLGGGGGAPSPSPAWTGRGRERGKCGLDEEWACYQRQYVAVARLLHIERLQKVQQEVSAVLERLQLLTANPKTDRSLAKVGF